MSGGVRAGVAILVVGLLFIWLIRPIGSACSDLDKLPSGSEGSSAPSFAPPLTRTCTYTTPEGTKARKRYVPVLDVVALLIVAGVAGGAIALLGAGGRERAPKPARAVKPPQPERAKRSARDEPPPEPVPASADADAEQARRERDAAERERARQEREARRSR